MTDPHSQHDKAIPDQLMQIAHEQEGGAERVLFQIEVVQNSFEEIQSLVREVSGTLSRMMPDSEEKQRLIDSLEQIALHADNGMYNVQGVYDLFQYQDIIRQKLEKVGHRLIDVSEYILANLLPQDSETNQAALGGRDIMERKAQEADIVKGDADAIVAEFFAKMRASKPKE